MPIGILYAFLAYASFSTSDAFIKSFGQPFSIFQISFFITLFAAIPMLIAVPRDETWADFWRMKHPFSVQVRSVSGVIGGYLAVTAFTTLPLAEAYALIFLIPLFVTVLSIPILKEKIGWRRWAATGAGFCGVLLVVQPGFKELTFGHAAAGGVAVFGAISIIALRASAGDERRVTLLTWPFLYAAGANGALMLDGFVEPSGSQLLHLAAAGGFAGMALVLMVAATKGAPASLVAPTQYSQIGWAVAIGYFIFNETVDVIALCGLGVVAAAGIATFLREETVTGWAHRTPLFRNRI